MWQVDTSTLSFHPPSTHVQGNFHWWSQTPDQKHQWLCHLWHPARWHNQQVQRQPGLPRQDDHEMANHDILLQQRSTPASHKPFLWSTDYAPPRPVSDLQTWPATPTHQGQACTRWLPVSAKGHLQTSQKPPKNSDIHYQIITFHRNVVHLISLFLSVYKYVALFFFV